MRLSAFYPYLSSRWTAHASSLRFTGDLTSCFFSPNSVLLGVLNSFFRCVRPLCHCWCPPFSAGHTAFLFICLPGDFFTFVSQVRCLHCWCPPFSAGPGAFLFICLAGDFFTFVSQVRCLHCWCPPFSAGPGAFLFICLHVTSLLLSPRFGACTAGVRPFPLAIQHFYSFVST